MARVKIRYRLRLRLRIFDNIDCGKKTVYHVDMLTSMRWMCTEREAFHAASTKKMCFTLLPTKWKGTSDVDKTGGYDELRVGMKRNATKNGVIFLRIGMDALMNLEDVDDVVVSVTFEKLRCTAFIVVEEAT